MIRRLAVTTFGVLHGLTGDPVPPRDESAILTASNGLPRLGTVVTPYDPLRHAETYKVFTHLYGRGDAQPLTKGVGGFDSHQRGVCIGWRKTQIGATTLDSWHMIGCSQRAVPDTIRVTDTSHSMNIEWCDTQGRPFLRENRAFSVLPDTDDIRWCEVHTRLEANEGPIRLQGDPHHGGLHIRLANEVCRHPWSTRYYLPKTARWGHDDAAHGAWWVLARFVVRSRPWWLVFMTNPFLGAAPVYSARAYGKLGAFMEPVIEPGAPFTLQCRLGLSDREITPDECEDAFDRTEWEAGNA